MRTVRRVVALLAVALPAVALTTGCADPKYQFIGNSARDLVLRVPSSWTQVNSADVLKAAGQDPANAVGWTAFFDAASPPSPQHALSAYADAPVLVALSEDVPVDQRDSITGDVLRDMIVPVTEQGLAQQQLSAAASGAPTPTVKLVRQSSLAGKTERGVHVLYTYTVAGRTEVYDKVAVADPKRTQVHLALVHCSLSCYDANSTEMDKVVSSLTVKSQ